MTIFITCHTIYFEPQRHYNTNLDPLEELSALCCDNSDLLCPVKAPIPFLYKNVYQSRPIKHSPCGPTARDI